jgi:hypothetical protein
VQAAPEYWLQYYNSARVGGVSHIRVKQQMWSEKQRERKKYVRYRCARSEGYVLGTLPVSDGYQLNGGYDVEI